MEDVSNLSSTTKGSSATEVAGDKLYAKNLHDWLLYCKAD
jgi:hypothetical protein